MTPDLTSRRLSILRSDLVARNGLLLVELCLADRQVLPHPRALGMVRCIAECVPDELAPTVESALAPRLVDDVQKRACDPKIDPVDLGVTVAGVGLRHTPVHPLHSHKRYRRW